MPDKAGRVVSTTLILNVPWSDCPSESVTVQLTVVQPSGMTVPAAGEQTGVGGGLSWASVADTMYAAWAPPVVLPSTVLSAGRLSTGGVSKVTLTGKVADVELLLASVAVQVTFDAPIGATAPGAGLHETLGLASTTSV